MVLSLAPILKEREIQIRKKFSIVGSVMIMGYKKAKCIFSMLGYSHLVSDLAEFWKFAMQHREKKCGEKSCNQLLGKGISCYQSNRYLPILKFAKKFHIAFTYNSNYLVP